jgi:hypothetical protein
MLSLRLIFYVILLLFAPYCLSLPPISLGSSSFLDGGPLRPKPGFYWQQYLRYYHADAFFNAEGTSLSGVPNYNSLSTSAQFSYQDRFFAESNFQLGLTVSFPAVLYSRITHNDLGLSSSGSGFGNLYIGPYIQFDARKYQNGFIFMHRIEFDIGFPTAKNVSTKSTNPGSNFFYIDPYWSFTLYLNSNLATSGRFYYLYSGRDHKADTQSGTALHGNYTVEYRASEKVWIGLNNYFLQQLTDDKSDGIKVPNSKQRIVATGFGTLYKITQKDRLFINLYFEFAAKNRFQGMLFQLRFYKYFD